MHPPLDLDARLAASMNTPEPCELASYTLCLGGVNAASPTRFRAPAAD